MSYPKAWVDKLYMLENNHDAYQKVSCFMFQYSLSIVREHLSKSANYKSKQPWSSGSNCQDNQHNCTSEVRHKEALHCRDKIMPAQQAQAWFATTNPANPKYGSRLNGHMIAV